MGHVLEIEEAKVEGGGLFILLVFQAALEEVVRSEEVEIQELENELSEESVWRSRSVWTMALKHVKSVSGEEEPQQVPWVSAVSKCASSVSKCANFSNYFTLLQGKKVVVRRACLLLRRPQQRTPRIVLAPRRRPVGMAVGRHERFRKSLFCG